MNDTFKRLEERTPGVEKAEVEMLLDAAKKPEPVLDVEFDATLVLTVVPGGSKDELVIVVLIRDVVFETELMVKLLLAEMLRGVLVERPLMTTVRWELSEPLPPLEVLEAPELISVLAPDGLDVVDALIVELLLPADVELEFI